MIKTVKNETFQRTVMVENRSLGQDETEDKGTNCSE